MSLIPAELKSSERVFFNSLNWFSFNNGFKLRPDLILRFLKPSFLICLIQAYNVFGHFLTMKELEIFLIPLELERIENFSETEEIFRPSFTSKKA